MIASESDRAGASPTAAVGAPAGIETASPAEVRALLERGEAVLVDVREPFEHRAERIEGAICEPLGELDARGLRASRPGTDFIFHCRSGGRSARAAGRFAAETGAPARHMEGGILAWKAAGLPTHRATRAPIDVMRQVQVTAGSLVVIGVALGVLVNAWFLALSAFVGAGLIFAGTSGWCGMAKMLGVMPWNRPQ
jgi:rhodanese-related sulfurtransferase